MVANSATTANASQVLLPGNLPADVREWLSRTAAALIQSFADDLRSLILFGSAAEGRMRASSDVNSPGRLVDNQDPRLRGQPFCYDNLLLVPSRQRAHCRFGSIAADSELPYS